LNRPETLTAAFEGANGVFLITNFGEKGTDEHQPGNRWRYAPPRMPVVKHFVWSTLPDVEGISGGKLHVPTLRQGQRLIG